METQRDWIRELVQAEEQLETQGIVDPLTGYSTEEILLNETQNQLGLLKNRFIEVAATFNDMKASPLGRIKIYGIAKTAADFMLFRNGFKMVFSMVKPGQISIRSNFIGTQMTSAIPTLNHSIVSDFTESILILKAGPFQDLIWTFQEQPVRIEAIVKYHFSLFLRESLR